jgi:hypothetical protein
MLQVTCHNTETYEYLSLDVLIMATKNVGRTGFKTEVRTQIRPSIKQKLWPVGLVPRASTWPAGRGVLEFRITTREERGSRSTMRLFQQHEVLRNATQRSVKT